MSLRAYNEQYKGSCWKCGKYGHRPNDQESPKYKKEQKTDDDKKEENDYRKKSFSSICYHCGQRGHMIEDC